MTQTLAEQLPKEIERCQELLVAYQDIGPPGAFAAAMLKQAIADAHKLTNAEEPTT